MIGEYGDTAVGDDEDTTVVAAPDFGRRRFRARLDRWRRWIILALVAILLVTGGWLIYFSSVLAVSQVEVTGNARVTTARVERVAGVPIGRPMVRTDLAAIKARVEAIHAVESVAVSRSWPHTVVIEIVERTPVAVVDRGGKLQALDASGVLFGGYSRAPDDLPLVETRADVSASALAEAAKVVGALRADVAGRVEKINVQTIDKINLELTKGVTVQWGSAEGSEDKAQVLVLLLKRKGVKEIDVSVPGRPTTR
ncbi:cell division protein FtsQ [Marmoricola sp. OAE513]|uniref:cell division protein FtsQ/DivIB n=1 Tax=Marmoricola sp. OAE513 TaxID=2817894 RepID=UPI001AE9EA54